METIEVIDKVCPQSVAQTTVNDHGDQSFNPSVSSLKLDVVDSTERSRIMQQWREFEDQIGNTRLACSSDWIETWLDRYGDLIPHRFAVLRQNEKVRGFTLLTSGVGQFDGPAPLKTWHIGTAGEPEADSVVIEYNTVLCESADRLEFLELVHKWMSSQRGVDVTCFDGFGTDEIEDFLLRNPKARVERKLACVFDIQKARDAGVEPIELLGSHTRAGIRRSIRQMGMPTGEWIESTDRALVVFEELVQLHQVRWNALGKPGVYASKRFTDFHRALIEKLVPKGRMVLFRVASPDGLVGISHCFVDADRVLGYQIGWVPQTSSASPGLVVDYLLIHESMKRGFRCFDFLAGTSEYKKRLSTDEVRIVWASWRKPRLKFAIVENLRRIKRALKNVKKSLRGAKDPIARSESRVAE